MILLAEGLEAGRRKVVSDLEGTMHNLRAENRALQDQIAHGRLQVSQMAKHYEDDLRWKQEVAEHGHDLEARV